MRKRAAAAERPKGKGGKRIRLHCSLLEHEKPVTYMEE